MTRVDMLLVRIERTLAECDASRLPPLTSEPAAAVLDLAEQAGMVLTPWQERWVRSMHVEPVGRRNGKSSATGRTWWRRWWSR